MLKRFIAVLLLCFALPLGASAASIQNARMIATGGFHTVALRSDGTVWAWGDNDNGQLGNGTITSYGGSTPVELNLPGPAIAVAAGTYHSVALMSDGTVLAWGDNRAGQLGNGTTVSSSVPVPVKVPVGVTVTAIAAGGGSTVALTRDGHVWAWGVNTRGELGDGTTTSAYSSEPVLVSGLSDVTAIATGGYYGIDYGTMRVMSEGNTMALKSDGTVWVWGDNTYGQLGPPTLETYGLPYVNNPVPVTGLSDVAAIAEGFLYEVVLKKDGAVWTWGRLDMNQMPGFRPPVQVTGLTGVTAIAAGGGTTMALKSDGTVWAWGDNSYGQVGNGTVPDYLGPPVLPAQVVELTGVTAIAEGLQHSVALKSDGTVWAWGDNRYSQLGSRDSYTAIDPNTPDYVPEMGIYSYQQTHMSRASGKPLRVATVPGGVRPRIAAGDSHTVLLNNDGSVWAWGGNASGQLGSGTTTDSNTPVVVGLQEVVAVAGGGRHTSALKSDGTVWSWGENTYGQLGTGTTMGSNTPQQVTDVTGVVNGVTAVAAGGYHTVALKDDGTVWSWGRNCSGQLGNGTSADSYTPVQVTDISGVIAVVAGLYHTVVLKSNGSVWAWGGNSSGQLGNGTSADSYTPVQVTGLTGVIAIAAGWNHTVALKSDGTVWAWGDNTYGQLGTSTTAGSNTPQPIAGVTGVIAIAAGGYHTLALEGDGTVWAWGRNNYGQLGTGTTVDITPQPVAGVTGVIAIAAGGYHTIALGSDGAIWAWGHNGSGQLGNGGNADSGTPVRSAVNTDTVPPYTTAFPPGGTYVDFMNPSVTLTTSKGATIYFTLDGSIPTYPPSGTTQVYSGPVPFPRTTTTLTYFSRDAAGNVEAVKTQTYIVYVSFSINLPGTGNGCITVTPPPPGGGCVTSYGGTFKSGTVVTAIPTVLAPGLRFSGWSGCDSVSDNQCTVSVRATGSVTATFDLQAFSLSASPTDPSGGGTVTPSSSIVNYGDSAFFTIIPTVGYRLLGLTDNGKGVIAVEGPPGSFTYSLNNVSADHTVAAWFGVASSVTPQVAGGGSHSVVLKSDGTVWGWGGDGYGQLGDGTTTDSGTPLQVAGFSEVTAVAAGLYDTVALKSDGTVWAWGGNGYGQLGNGTMTDSHSPVRVVGLSGVITAIAAGKQHTLALRSDGTVWAWGWNNNGQLGNGASTNSSAPVQVTGLAKATAIAAGNGHSLALRSDGTVWGWGDNSFGQLGNGTTANSSTPTQVSGLTAVIAVAAGNGHSLALKRDGTVWAWGQNNNGQLGNGTTASSSAPVQVSGFTGVIAIAGGNGHSLALKSDGTVWAWGDNSLGQLGNGATTSSSAAVQVSGLAGVTAIAAGDYHSLALKSDGTVSAWGGNSSGQLGNGTTTDSGTPVQTNPDPGGGTGFVIATGTNVMVGSRYFATIGFGFPTLSDGGILLAQGMGFTENLVFNRPISFTLQGGHDASFSAANSTTTIHGSIFITSGTVNVENIVITQ